MLLLVVAAQLGELQRSVVERPGGEACGKVLVDVGAVAAYLRDAGAGDQPPLGSGMPRTNGFVVRIEEVAERRVVDVVSTGWSENELLEEPRRMGPVPLRRARVGHRLRSLILGGESRRQDLGHLTDSANLRVQVEPGRRQQHLSASFGVPAFCVPWPGPRVSGGPEGPHLQS